MRVIRVFGVVSALALTVAAFSAFQREYGAFRLQSEDEPSRFQRLELGDVALSPSLRAQTAVLRVCDESQRSLFGQVQPTATRQAIAENCSSLAQSVLTNAPTSSLAHYVAAQTHLELGEFDEFNSALLISQRAGPAQGWIAERRLDVAIKGYDHLTELGSEALARDITQLITSAAGVVFVADRFARNNDIREIVLTQAETVSASEQRRFLAEVENALNRTANGG